MTKADLIADIANRTGLPKKEVAEVVNALFASLKEAFARKERVELRGFGIFTTKVRKPRVGRNPKTREEVRIPQRNVVVFKPSKIVKEKVN
ncbi:MAG: integration host factor subunit beta [Candidatus Hydrothermae bacterium]|uniref:Integration host factor subunit beta n=1 Tax=candidate division WOR-3 bacterium TaxID=2052148 RepID=A0A7C1B9U8_UNCW3|nr:integration host factor subunit beta [Candidatus Hydrothermae bacterium]MCD6382322.1 integration host factor subunit beta [Candidatus Hydrothermae bacterium]RKY94363.1 MAG: integration host factor subunit alpha [Candidatus Hydrothermae bacterium]HDM89971.1 integration host factor subunit beta [candidate division WOR-3 bacterium]